MLKQKKEKPLKFKTINIPMDLFANAEAQIPVFKKAAKRVMRDIKTHFTTKGEGWPIDYSFYVTDIFYAAMGHHLENYLLRELAKSKLPIELSSTGYGRLMLRLSDKKKRSK